MDLPDNIPDRKSNLDAIRAAQAFQRGQGVRRRGIARRVLELKKNNPELSFRKIAKILGISHTSAAGLYRRALVAPSSVWAEYDDERAWEPTSEREERCPRCGRVSTPPCLACFLKRNGEPVLDDERRVDFRDFDVDLTPSEYERYVKIRDMKKARCEKRSQFWARD